MKAPKYSPLRAPTTGLRHALLHTLPGRAIVIGVLVKLAIVPLRAITGGLSSFATVVDTVAGLAVAAGLTYFVVQLFAAAQRRLLWRVRRKLVLSYVFVGFVPALLLLAFSLLSAFLLFYNLSSYLVQTRLRSLSEEGRFLAEATALEIERAGARDLAPIVARRQLAAAASNPNASIAVLPIDGSCRADGSIVVRTTGPPVVFGPWSHVAPPRQAPAWLTCAGFAGVVAYTRKTTVDQGPVETSLLVRAVSFGESRRPSHAVVVDLLVDETFREQLRRDTGVTLKSVSAVGERDVSPLEGLPDARQPVPVASSATGLLANLPSLMEYRDWSNGKSGTVTLTSGLSVGELYDRISASEGRVGRNLGQGLLLLLFVIAVLFLTIQLIALIAGVALARSITGAVHQLFTGTERVRQGDFTHKITVRTNDQLGELAGSFNAMTASIEDLLRQAAEKKRLEEELRIAHEIQMSLLPQGPFVMPGLSVTALCVPAREVGGDYYDILPLDDDRLGVLIADVSGKGTSAALYMAELKGLILSLSRIHTSPRALLIDANRVIAEHLDARSFITMTYAVIDLRARTMTYSRAGHTPLIYVPGSMELAAPGASHVRILAPDGLVLGLKLDGGEMFERLLEEQTIPLRPGDIYLFFTDGISEAMDSHEDCFGEGRLSRLVESHAHLPSDELRERVLREIAAFVGDAPQHDDMTMILLKVDEVQEAVA